MIRTVLYDLDGVIVDSRAAVASALRDVTQAALGVAPSRVAIDELAHLPPVQVLAELGVTDPAQAFDEHFDAAYAVHARRATVVRGITAAMWQIRLAGRRQAIVTLQRRHRLTMLNLGDVPDLIDTVVTFEDAAPKPAPDPIWLALDRLGMTPGEACFVGDTATDIQAGRAAGVFTCGATWGYRSAEALSEAGADLLLGSPHEIVTMALNGPAVTVGYDFRADSIAARFGSNP